MRVQRHPTGPDRQGSRVSRVPPAKRPQLTGGRRQGSHPPRNANFFPCRAVPRQVGLAPPARVRQGPKAPPPRATDEPDAISRARCVTKPRRASHSTPARLKTRWNSLSQNAAHRHARTRSRRAGRRPCLPSRLRPFATPPVPTADPGRTNLWNSNYPGCSARYDNR